MFKPQEMEKSASKLSADTIMSIHQIPNSKTSSNSFLIPNEDDKMHYDADQLLQKQGYKVELQRNFSFWSLLGVAFGLTNSWLGVAGSMGEAISSGGPLMVVYGLIASFVFILPVGVTLSELISMYPNSGGQYFWIFQLAPRQNARFLLFMTGTFGWLGSVFTCSSITLTSLQVILACYQMQHPDFEQHPYHVFVCYLLLVCFVSIFNCWERPLPYISIIALAMSLLTFTIVLIACLSASSGEYAPALFVFTEAINVDKSMIGITFLVSLTLPTWAFSGLDAATHMSEELPIPERTIPKLIMSTIFIGFFTAFVLVVSLFFCIKDVEAAMSAPVPLLEIVHQLLNYNRTGLIALGSLAIATSIFSNTSANTWQARLCWSFARDNGIPGSKYWKVVNKKAKVPLNAHLFSNFLVILIGLVYLGSSNAYTSIVTASVVILYFSYLIPTICLLKKGRNNVIPGPFWLGKIGLLCNYITLFWIAFCLIFFSFPYTIPATAGNMNYVSAVYGACLAYVFIYWYFIGKNNFVSLEERLYDNGKVDFFEFEE